MIDATKRYAALILGLAAVAIVMSMASGSLVSWRGVPGPTVGVAIEPVRAIVMLVVCLTVCFGIAVFVGRMVNAAVAAFVVGGGLAVLSMQCGTHVDLMFAGAAPFSIAIETMVWAIAVLLVAAGLMRLTGPLPDQPWNEARTATDPKSIFDAEAVRGAAGAAVALVAVWAVAANDLKGQAIAATTIAGVGAGLAGRMLAPRVQPVLLFAAPLVFIAIGQAWTGFSGVDSIAAWSMGKASGLGIPTPLDAAAGSLMGVAMGLGWSRSFVEEHAE
ncbi:MAG: hypothetical protein RLZZ461_1578 [Planctomycetota bacterium]|jgi:hypothetical protein